MTDPNKTEAPPMSDARDSMRKNLKIEDIGEFGPKYRATCADYLRRNDCGEPVGYAFRRDPMLWNGIAASQPVIDLIGTKGIVTITCDFRASSVRMLHPFEGTTDERA
jgi:hypothetical protein